jgi:flagellar protein FliO/FliZ
MAEILTYLFAIALLAFAIAAAYWVTKTYLGGQSPTAALFGPRAERRLGVVEHANVDGRRRLILVRRDGIEHLIMTGGPVDVVIETGIGERNSRGSQPEHVAATPIFTRQPRLESGSQANKGERTPERAAE